MVSSDQRMLEAAPDAIVVADEHGYVTQFNPAAERLFGYVSTEILGRNIARLFSSGKKAQSGNEWKGLLTSSEYKEGRTRALEITARRSNDEVFPVWLAIGVTEEQSGPQFVAIFRDLSAQKAAVERLRRLEARLSALTRIELAGEVAAGIAHDINQPLSAIAAYAQAAKRLIRSGSPDLHVLEDVCEKIDQQARRAGDVVQGIRDLIHRPKPQATLLDINNVVADAMSLIEADAGMEGVSVTAEYTRPLPAVRGDAIQLQSVLVNLVRNSLEAMRDNPRGERRILIGTSAGEDGRVRVSVSDRGPGVSATLGTRIFDPFITSRREQLGVGLSISQTDVKAHEGSLSYESDPDGGSIFVIDLPACDPGVMQ